MSLIAAAPHQPRGTIIEPPEPIRVLYRDDDLIAVDKPPGLFVHRSYLDPRESRNLVSELKQQLGLRVLPIHRLDRPTSGVLILGLHTEAARRLTRSFETHEVEKQYLAIVRGWTEDAGIIDLPLKEEGDRIATPWIDENRPAQEAHTEYQTLARSEINISAGKYPTSRYSLVRAVPRTGRRHQIRRHLNHLTHPVIGDSRHGDHRHNQLFVREFNITRMLLIARRLEVPHPFREERLLLQAEPDAQFHRALQTLSMSLPDEPDDD